ncbi:hypothetical protein HALO59_150488 [Halomonas sp. 59]|nr:hypothetical protein HALO59_150488 [Halomonas sp. 59]CAD5260861.1 hypothetical protein HALO113_160490 [Halomonas sp. 113]
MASTSNEKVVAEELRGFEMTVNLQGEMP